MVITQIALNRLFYEYVKILNCVKGDIVTYDECMYKIFYQKFPIVFCNCQFDSL